MLRIQWKFFYKSLFYVLIPIPCISVAWTIAAHLVFSSYVCCLQNTFEAPEKTESDEKKPIKKRLLLMQRFLVMRTFVD